MAIDGIGRAGGPVSGLPTPVTGSEGPATPFQVGATAPTTKGLLEKLQRGELDLQQYLDGHVEQAVTPFKDKLSAEHLDTLRGVLREQAATDPVLVEWIRRATGAVPVAPAGSEEGDSPG
jgi:hypothetical protein